MLLPSIMQISKIQRLLIVPNRMNKRIINLPIRNFLERAKNAQIQLLRVRSNLSGDSSLQHRKQVLYRLNLWSHRRVADYSIVLALNKILYNFSFMRFRIIH